MAPEHALDRLYRRYARDVYRFAYGLVRNRADAEDVAQTAFLNAYRAIERGHRPESPRSWLLSIARNVHRQRLRGSQRRVQEVALDVELAEAVVLEESTALDPPDVARALEQLAPNQRAALVMRELEGRSYAEIATALRLSDSAVETLLFRGRRALREQLEAGLTCAEAERLIADGRRSRQLRAHLRACAACSTAARSARARRSALRSLFGLPWLGGGTTAVATKVAAVVVATGIAGGLTQLPRVAPAAKPHAAARVRHTTASMPIAAELAVPERHTSARRPAAVVRHPDTHVATTTAVAPAPIPSTAHPDATTVTAPPATPPSAPPVPTTTSTPAAAPPQPAAPPPTTTTTTPTTTETTTTTAPATTVVVQTPPLPVVPAVTLTVTLPSLPPVQVPGLTQNSQNSGARNPALGHLIP